MAEAPKNLWYKAIKNRIYFKRFQVKFRRRRSCVTDYFARRRMLVQDKNKYGSPKYRFVVRISNRDCCCQLVTTTLDCKDVVIKSAYAHELRRYGVPAGYSNYPAVYATGLLLARRALKHFKLDELFEANTSCGEVFDPMDYADEKNPLKAILDVGLARTTTGAKVFAALKGAVDGGINIPHKVRRFPGSKKTKKGDWEINSEKLVSYIMGQRIAKYMTSLQEKDSAAFAEKFSKYIKLGMTADKIPAMYEAAHAAILENPEKKREAEERGSFGTRTAPKGEDYVNRRRRLNKKERRNRIKQILTAKGRPFIEL